MNVNKRIAEWAGWKPPENPDWCPEGLEFHVTPDGKWYDTKLQRDLGKGERLSCDEVQRWMYWTSPDGRAMNHLPEFDTDITLWHGKDGLLAEIGKQDGGVICFQLVLADMLDVPTEDLMLGWASWRLLAATPAQLAAALVKMIEGE